jgi:phosphoenolpyruvate synthase/pyruvate phosphate dikinase
MIQQLQPLGVDVPGGFGVSSTAYDAMMDQFHLRERIELVLKDLDGKHTCMEFLVCVVKREVLIVFLLLLSI